MRELKSIIIKLKHKDKREFVIKILDEFIIKYPNNIYAKIEYSKLLFLSERYDECISYLNSIDNYMDYLDIKEKEMIISNLMYCYYNLGKFNDVLNIIDNNISLVKSEILINRMKTLYTIVKYKLGILEFSNIDSLNISYSCRQCIKYDEKLAEKHILEHRFKNENSEFNSVFSNDINISDLMLKIKKDLPNAKYNYRNGTQTVYQYYYPSIGYTEEQVINYLSVIVISGTFNIITMYPSEKRLDVINYLTPSLENFKQESMIDKFNRKYKK